jgi:hypothetical protein
MPGISCFVTWPMTGMLKVAASESVSAARMNRMNIV